MVSKLKLHHWLSLIFSTLSVTLLGVVLIVDQESQAAGVPLIVTTLPAPPAKQIAQGMEFFDFAHIELDATQATEDIQVTALELTHTTSQSLIQTNIANLKLYDHIGAVLTAAIQPSAVSSSEATNTFTLSSPLTIPQGTSLIIYVKGDVVAGLPGQTHSFGCATGCVTAVGLETSEPVSLTVADATGQTMTLVGTGSLIINPDPKDRAASLFAAGLTGEEIGSFSFAALTESVEVEELTLTDLQDETAAGLSTVFDKLYLYDEAEDTLLAEAVPGFLDVKFTLADEALIIIPDEGEKAITIKADLAQIAEATTFKGGATWQLHLFEDDIKATGVITNKPMPLSNVNGDYKTKRHAVFKSVPTVTRVAQASDSLTDGAARAIYSLKINSNAAGDVALYKLSFRVKRYGSNLELSNYELWDIAGGEAVNLTADTQRNCDQVVDSQTCVINLLFKTAGAVTQEAIIIPANSSKTLELRADVAGAVNNTRAEIRLEGDTDTEYRLAELPEAVDARQSDNFIWSDLHGSSTSTELLATTQWFSGFRVAGLVEVGAETLYGSGLGAAPPIDDEFSEVGESEASQEDLDSFMKLDVETEAQVSDEVQALRLRIKSLKRSVSELERQVVALERKLTKAVNQNLTSRLKGRILLQVEAKGEAWYLDHLTGERFYLKDGDTAYSALQVFGLGITNADLEKIPIGVEDRAEKTDTDGDGLDDQLEAAIGSNPEDSDSDDDGFDDGQEVKNDFNHLGSGARLLDHALAKRLEGKILLQVERKGEAWYIHNGRRHYMKNGHLAYQIMRFLSLGITNEDLRQIAVGELE